jgi:murein DD-endopeptidase MepM/ murein hydrolase activator NlpD
MRRRREIGAALVAVAVMGVSLLLMAPSAGSAPSDHRAAPGGVGFSLEEARVRPREAYFDGERPVSVRFDFEARRPVSLKILVVDAKRERTVARLRERDAQPGEGLLKRWDGVTDRGRAADDGRYEIRIGPVGERAARFAGGFRLRGHAFPVAGPHGTRGAIGEYGAPRSGGRRHEGFDITADCGTPLVAARGGEVIRAGFDPVLYGYYLLINGSKTNESYFYSHLVAASPFQRGDRVRTREVVGRVGKTGNAASTPCHLHFEIRRSGRPVDPKPALRRWDDYS